MPCRRIRDARQHGVAWMRRWQVAVIFLCRVGSREFRIQLPRAGGKTMGRRLMVVFAALAVFALASCARSVSAWEHYDACSKQGSFHDMVACGKARRQNYCEANKDCSPNGDAVVAYADSLD